MSTLAPSQLCPQRKLQVFVVESQCCADQPTNCRYMCHEWEIGIEADSNAKREEVEKLVNELMVGEKGKKMRERTLQLKKKTEE